LRKSGVSATLGATCEFDPERPPHAMHKPLAPVLVLAVAVAVLAGCGGGGSKSSGSGGGGDASKVNGITVGNCLNQSDFLVQPEIGVLNGQAPSGVVFTLTFYKTNAAAKAAAAKKNPKTTALVDLGVVDFKGNPSIYKGAPPAKISDVELAAIKSCIAKGK
jgi:hypothetical protein